MQKMAVAALFMFLAPSAKADPVSRLTAFLMRPEQQQAISSLMDKQWSSIVENCPSPKTQDTRVDISKAPTFDPKGTPKSGQWRVVSRYEGCGASRVFNVEYVFAPNGQMKRIGLLPGNTLADMTLQNDALMYAAMGMGNLAPKDCDDMTFLDTKFIGFDESQSSTPSKKRSWSEEWTVRACGVTGVVTMHFAPDATGTTITSELDRTRKISP